MAPSLGEVDDVSAIEHERRLLHARQNARVVEV
jgi:hypothetical protein